MHDVEAMTNSVFLLTVVWPRWPLLAALADDEMMHDASGIILLAIYICEELPEGQQTMGG